MMVRRISRFLMVGALATAWQYVVLVLLVQVAGWNPTPATALGFSSSAIGGYFANKRITWASDARHREAMSKYLVLCLTGLLLNVLIVEWLTSLLAPYLLAQVIATGVTLIINFLSNNFWTFRRSAAKVS